jgi:cysteine-rich repeat protein
LFSALAACGDGDSPAVDASSCTPVDDANECTEDICENDQPVNRNRDAGETCSAGVCDGAGACVECTENSHCTGGEVCDQDSNACIAPNCMDGDQNGDETCVDGGGACAPMRRCDDGEGCEVAGDCTSGVCGAGNTCSAPSCGDGVRQGAEACDDGNNTNGDGCDDGAGDACRPTGCGNGVVTGTEQCDDNNANNGDGCDNNCTNTGCGNGIITTGETCDDLDTTAGDGCDATCQTEAGYTCTGLPSVCVATCGDGMVAATEACDDAPPAESGDGCSITCTVEPGFGCTGSPSVCTAICGDGIRATTEGCDDGDADGGDGCSASCFVEPGFVCAGTPSACFPICGDSQTVPGEPCDDPAPAENGDGCSALCVVESGYTCTGSPSDCDPICGDGVMRPGEGCDDGDADAGDGCSDTCQVELGYQCQGTPSVCALTCGNNVIDSGETCDDGDLDAGDGCSTTCATETGWNCTGAPSVCVTVCGDGIIAAGVEQCDDAPPAESGDGCSATCTIESGWSCTGAPSACITTCGDGITAGTETCDDNNTTNLDGCSATCQLECGNGTFNGLVEQCEDGNRNNGDGCSSTCTFEVSCGPGEVLTQIRSTDVPKPIVDNVPAGSNSIVTVPATAGAVRKVIIGVGRISHEFTGDVEVKLTGPNGRTRMLFDNRGSSGDHLINTRFDDNAATSVVSGTPPYTGFFRPEQTISDLAGGFGGFSATGTWTLNAADTAAVIAGTLEGWTLMLCTAPTAGVCGDGTPNPGEECDDGNTNDADACTNGCQVTDGCGDGNIDSGELCDDNNIVSGDGCSSTCTLGLACGPGETAVTVGNASHFDIPDNLPAGVDVPVTVVGNGGVTRAMVYLSSITHANDTDLDMFLVGPNGLRRELSTDNGSTGDNYANTFIHDDAPTAITAGVAPFGGRFRSEQALSAFTTVDFRGINAAGTWNLNVADDLVNTPAGGGVDGWTLMLCVAPSFCGDGTTNAGEECDDGNTDNADNCSNLCVIADGCADGNLDAGEQCDDNNVIAGDGCSSTCTSDIGCAANETAVIVSNDTQVSVPDQGAGNGAALSTLTVPTAGVVRRVFATVDVTHPANGDVHLFLDSPGGKPRLLSNDNGGANYRATIFSDSATPSITVGSSSAPYTGAFRPEEALSDANGFLNQSAQGTWTIRMLDDASSNVGTLNRWTLALCVDTAVTATCGNGFADDLEQCDDGNLTNGDGCSNTCQLELSCPAGSTPLVTRASTGLPFVVPDNNAGGGVTNNLTVGATGVVRKAVVLIRALPTTFVGDINFSLLPPVGGAVDLTSGNGGGGDHFFGTMFDDGAGTAITAASAPYRGRFRPEAALNAVDGQAAAGTWGVRVADSANGDVGALHGWTLGLCVQ